MQWRICIREKENFKFKYKTVFVVHIDMLASCIYWHHINIIYIYIYIYIFKYCTGRTSLYQNTIHNYN